MGNILTAGGCASILCVVAVASLPNFRILTAQHRLTRSAQHKLSGSARHRLSGLAQHKLSGSA